VHVVGHVAAQRPLQQRGIAVSAAQSDDDEQVLGHAWTLGFRQRPLGVRLGSTAWTVVQQVSPWSVLHCESSVHGVGHSDRSVQMGRS
jgi:hypothetical protein